MFFVVASFNNCGITKKGATEEKLNSQMSPLVAYGEKIFKRESCKNCHTLQVEHETLQLISLDGVGGKYPSGWLYNYLFEPQSLIPESKKGSYNKLYTRPLDKKIVSEMSSNMEKDKSWVDFIKEVAVIEKDVMDLGITPEKTEILALLAYIQQIPATKKKKELDNIERQKYLNKQKIWDNISLDSTNIIIQIAADNANKEKGKLIYQTNCSPCHGTEGQGLVGPNLTDEYWLHGGEKTDIARTIIFGVP